MTTIQIDSNNRWIAEFLDWPIDHFLSELKNHPDESQGALKLYADTLAIDYMRKLGKGEEKRIGAWYIFEHAGHELAEMIADNYPQYWTGE